MKNNTGHDRTAPRGSRSRADAHSGSARRAPRGLHDERSLVRYFDGLVRDHPSNKYVTDSAAVAAVQTAASAWNGVANIRLAYAGTTSGHR